MNIKSFSDAIICLINESEEICSLTGNDDRDVLPYYVKTLKSFSKSINTKNARDYIPGNVKDSERFPGLRDKFKEIYEVFKDDFSQPLLSNKKVNDDWLKINTEISEGEFCSDIDKQDSSLLKNRGLTINIFTPTIVNKKKGALNVEIAISEFYRAAIYIDKNISKKPRRPYKYIYLLYNCIKFSHEPGSLDSEFYKSIDDIYERRSEFLENDKSGIGKAISSVKDKLSGVLGDNVDSMSGMIDSINGGLNDLTDDSIDKIADDAQNAVKSFENSKNRDAGEVIGDIMGVDSKQVEKTMKSVGLHEKNIKSILNKAAGIDETKSQTNKELLSSIPDIDSFLSNK